MTAIGERVSALSPSHKENPTMCEIVSISRFDPKDQKTVKWTETLEEARAYMEERRKTEPLRYLVLYAHWSSFTRIATYHTL